MKKAIIRFSMFVFLIFFAQVSPVFAHPADLYVHSIYVTLAKDRLSIKWELKPGPMLVSFIWFEADTNMDDTVSAEEAQRWASSRVPLLTATFDGGQFPLQLDDLQFPSSRNTFQSGAETITIHLSAVWPQYRNNSYKLMLHNGLEEQKSISWYYITGQDGIEFQTPEQKNNIIALQIFEPSAQAFAQIPLRTDWDSSMPSLSLIQKGQEQDQQTTKSQATKRSLSDFVPSGKNTPQDILVNLVRQGQLSISFYLFALGVSLFLGALHALTPGHGKTVVAAYLVGSRGTSWHAVGLGTVVTLTHTGSVFLLGIITLVASRYILPTTLIPMFEIVSGLLIVGLGIYLFRQRFGQWRKAGASLTAQKTGTRKYSLNPVTSAGRIPSAAHRIQPVHTHAHGQGYMHDHGDGHFHSHDVPEMITWRSLIALGISGGLVPCPDAVAILLVAIAINRIVLGLALITSFSLGLAVVLIVIGLLMVNSRRLFDRVGIFERYAPILPMVSAFIVLALGAVLTVGALAQVKENLNLTGSISGSMNEAQVIYLAGGQDQVKQLFIADAYHPNPVLLSDATDNVVEYALSPDGTRAVYIVQTENLENRLWMVDLKSGARNQLTDCDNAICSRPVWSPDGKLIVYEYTRLSGNNLTGTSTLWQLDVGTGEAKPVFQEENLPGASPHWSPDGKWLSYITSQNIRLYNLETGENQIVSTTLGTAMDWSPDSQSVLYRDPVIQNGQFVTQLFVYNLTSQTSTNITLDAAYENLSAVWSPDGQWIAAIRRDLSVTQGDQVWLMRADGSQAHALTDQPDEAYGNLNWSPDGQYLLYDVYLFDSVSLERKIEIIEVDAGRITYPGINGYNAKWVTAK